MAGVTRNKAGRPIYEYDGRVITPQLERLLRRLSDGAVARQYLSDGGTSVAIRRLISWGLVDYIEVGGASINDNLYRLTDMGRLAMRASPYQTLLE